jgi:hypothetical protein
MQTKRWVQASSAAFLVLFVLEGIVHQVLLKGLYQQTASLWRPEADIQRLLWLFWGGYLVFAIAFVWIYAKGYEEKKGGLGQGIRFGLVMGILLSVMQNLGWYVVLPIPGILAWYWFLAGMAESLAMGICVGLIYRKG